MLILLCFPYYQPILVLTFTNIGLLTASMFFYTNYTSNYSYQEYANLKYEDGTMYRLYELLRPKRKPKYIV